MNWLLLVMSVAVVGPNHMRTDQVGPFKNREACLFAHRMVIQEQLNLKTPGKVKVTAVCVPEGRK